MGAARSSGLPKVRSQVSDADTRRSVSVCPNFLRPPQGWRVVTDTRRCIYKSPSRHTLCARVQCNKLHRIDGRALRCPRGPSPTRSWCRCPSSPARATNWRAGSTARSGSSGAPPTSRSTGHCARWRTTAGCTSRPSCSRAGPTRRCTPWPTPVAPNSPAGSPNR